MFLSFKLAAALHVSTFRTAACHFLQSVPQNRTFVPKYKRQISHKIRTCVEDFLNTSNRHENIFAKANFYSPCPFRSSFAPQQPDSCPDDTNGRPLCSGLPTQRIEGAACFWNRTTCNGTSTSKWSSTKD